MASTRGLKLTARVHGETASHSTKGIPCSTISDVAMPSDLIGAASWARRARCHSMTSSSMSWGPGARQCAVQPCQLAWGRLDHIGHGDPAFVSFRQPNRATDQFIVNALFVADYEDVLEPFHSGVAPCVSWFETALLGQRDRSSSRPFADGLEMLIDPIEVG